MRTDADRFYEIALGFITTQVTRALVQLGVPGRLANGPKSTDELAAAAGADPDGMLRLARAAAAFGLLEAGADGRYGLTSVGRLLQPGPGSLDALVLAMTSPGIAGTVEHLGEAVRTGASPAPKVHGTDLWSYYHANPEEAATFGRGMAGVTAATLPGLLAAFDPAPYEHIMDVGGGHGMVLAALLERAPGARGVLFDQPQMVAQAAPHDRIEPRGGDFLEEVPPGGDLYVIKNVLHDWGDADAGRILANCRRAGRPGHHLAIVEWFAAPVESENRLPPLLDFLLLCTLGGRLRTEGEFRSLLTANGYAIERMTPLSGAETLVLARAG